MSNNHSKRGCLASRAALLFFASILLALVSFSCVTEPSVNAFLLNDGRQQYFIRPISVNGKQVTSSIDFTVHVKDGKVANAVVMNYSLDGTPLGEVRADKVSLKLCCGEKEYELSNTKLLFKSMKPVRSRFSSTISEEDFTQMVFDSGAISVKFISSSGEELSVASPKIRKCFTDFQNVLDLE